MIRDTGAYAVRRDQQVRTGRPRLGHRAFQTVASPRMSAHFLAIDLGAESGRAMLGRLQSGILSLDELCRFPNEPVRQHGSLQWDMLRLWLEIQRGLERAAPHAPESIGIDTWGCDYALLGEHGDLLENPYHYRDARTDGVMEEVWQRVSREQIYAITGIQFLVFNTLYQLYAACRTDAQPHRRRRRAFATIPDLLNYWMTGELTRRIHDGDDDAVRRREDAKLGDRAVERPRYSNPPAAGAGRAGHARRLRCGAT